MFNYKYLTREHLEGFDNYKYMAIDTSPLSVYVMHPFWNKVVELVPKWVAPNVLTFAGFLLTVVDFVLLSYYDYDYFAASTPIRNATNVEQTLNGHTEIIPRPLWFVLAVFLFLAYTLDGIDGKQARRTQTSGPLGELFDHGLDSYSVFFIPACLYSIFGRADFSISPIRIYYVMWNLLLNFYISHWEKYNTGVLFLPWGYDFSMWASTLCFLWTGMKGTVFYKQYAFGSYTLANVFELLIYATGVFTNLPVSIYNIYRSYKLRTGKMRSPLEALRPLWSFLTVFAVLTIWVHKSARLPEYDLRVLFLLMGTIFSNVACRLIVSQMSNQRCETVCWLLWPLTFAASLSLLYPQYEIAAFYSVTVLIVLAHLHYGTCVTFPVPVNSYPRTPYIKKVNNRLVMDEDLLRGRAVAKKAVKKTPPELSLPYVPGASNSPMKKAKKPHSQNAKSYETWESTDHSRSRTDSVAGESLIDYNYTPTSEMQVEQVEKKADPILAPTTTVQDTSPEGRAVGGALPAPPARVLPPRSLARAFNETFQTFPVPVNSYPMKKIEMKLIEI